MSQFPQTRRLELDYGVDDRAVFNFFNTVYAWMCVGLAVTATVAWLVSSNRAILVALSGRGMAVMLMLGLWLLAYTISTSAHRIGPAFATGLFLLYSAAIGAVISYIFLLYRLPTIGGAFVMTAGTFGIMSVYGFVTKRDLSRFGSICVMAIVGLLLATLVNIFLASNALSWVITYAVLLVFIGLTAYDTQRLREQAIASRDNPRLAASQAIVGSLLLYLDFINMFMSILRIIGNRR